MTCLVCVLLAVHSGLSLAITPRSKSTSTITSAVAAETAASAAAAEAAADNFFALFLFLSVCVSAVLLRGDTVVCVVLLYLDDSVCKASTVGQSQKWNGGKTTFMDCGGSIAIEKWVPYMKTKFRLF